MVHLRCNHCGRTAQVDGAAYAEVIPCRHCGGDMATTKAAAAARPAGRSLFGLLDTISRGVALFGWAVLALALLAIWLCR